ncbi:MAG: carbamoyl-phosphate synthase small subunit, partial [Rhodospirillaceae bacterium]
MTATPPPPKPADATAVLVLADGRLFWGRGLGATGVADGEVCFNTAMTGYQEVLTDPSYAGQIITFCFPHIGNVGTNPEDIESTVTAARGLILRADITNPANWRAANHLDAWLKERNLVGLSGIDTRQLTRLIRDAGAAPNGLVAHNPEGVFDIEALQAQAAALPGLEGMDLAKEVSCTQSYDWRETRWSLDEGFGQVDTARHKVVAIDYGAKRNILRCLASEGCEITVLPATADPETVLRHEADGYFLSNGPGDPAATGSYAVPVIQ